MVIRILGGFLSLWGSVLLLKNIFIKPTLMNMIQFYGISSYIIGNVLGVVVGAGMLFLGIKWLFFSPSAKKKLVGVL